MSKNQAGRDTAAIGFPTESCEFLEIDVDFSFFAELVVILGTKINKRNIVFQDGGDGDKDGMRYATYSEQLM